MNWNELVEWQDSAAKAAREDMLREGRVIPKVMFMADGDAAQTLKGPGLTVFGEAAQESGPGRTLICLLRETSPEAILNLMHAVSPEPARFGLIWEMGKACGLSREDAAKRALAALQRETGASLEDIHWQSIRRFGAKVDAFAALNITETYQWQGGLDERPQGVQVRDMPGRTETVMVHLESRSKSRGVHLPIVRKDPADESSPVMSIGEPWVFEQPMEGRAVGLVRRAS